jgi:hypothetical protein
MTGRFLRRHTLPTIVMRWCFGYHPDADDVAASRRRIYYHDRFSKLWDHQVLFIESKLAEKLQSLGPDYAANTTEQDFLL